jgi:hypothetical protein
MNEFMNLVLQPLQTVAQDIKGFLPNLLAMTVILLLGSLLARGIQFILVKSLRAINFDSLCDRVGLTALMRKIGVWSKPAAMLGSIVFWLLITITLMIALSALRVLAIEQLVVQFFAYLPRAFSAVLILVIGFLLAGFISRAALIAAVNSGYHYARLLAEAVRMLITVLILAMAMEQLQIAPGIVLAAFSIIFGGIVVALAIAFGVGGIDAAKRMIERENVTPPPDEIEHL